MIRYKKLFLLFKVCLAVLLLFSISRELVKKASHAYKNRQDIYACNAPGRGDADGYSRYALWFAGGRPFWYESNIFKSQPQYNPYLTRIALSLSLDGKQFVSAGGDDQIQVWDFEGKRIKESTPAHQTSVTSIVQTVDGKKLVTGGWDGTIKIWSLNDFKLLQTIQTKQISVLSVSIDPKGKRIASGGWDGTVRVWDFDGHALVEPLRGHEGGVVGVSFSPDGTQIASASMDWTVKLWSSEGKLLATPLIEQNGIPNVRFLNNSRFITGGWWGYGHDCTLPVGGEWKCEKKWGNMSYNIPAVASPPSGAVIATGADTGEIHFWRPDGSEAVHRAHDVGVVALEYSHDGNTLVSGSRDGSIKLWNPDTGQLKVEILGAHKGFQPGTTFWGLPDYTRQAGYPIVVAAFMKLVGVSNSCAVLAIQPLLLIAFVCASFFLLLFNFGYLFAIGFLLPFLDKTNYFSFLASYDFIEFFIMTLYPLTILVLIAALKGKKTKTYFSVFMLLSFVLAQMKLVICIFNVLVVGSVFCALLVYKLIRPKKLDQSSFLFQIKVLGQALIFTILMALLVKYSYPEATVANEQLSFRKYIVLLAPKGLDAQLDKFRRLQDLINQRWAEINHHQSIPSDRVMDSVFNEIPLADVVDAHSHVDSKTGEVFYFSPSEVKIISYKLLKIHFYKYIALGFEEFSKKEGMLLQLTPFFEVSPKVQSLWLGFLLVGIFAICFYFNWAGLSILFSVFSFYCFFSIFHTVELRYWIAFSGFYYFTFAAGFAFAGNGLREFFKRVFGHKKVANRVS